MAIVAGNIVIGAVEKVKPEPVAPVQKSVLKNIEEIRKTAQQEPKPEKIIKKNKQVIIEKRAKLGDPKPDRKSAYVRDMTTVHKI